MTERYDQRPYVLPPDATVVILVRHGASAAYVPGEDFEMLEGTGNPALAPEGKTHARLVGARLAAETDIAAIYVTNLQRTHQTAAPLAEQLGLQTREVADLREVHLGEWEGGEMRVKARAQDPLFFEVLAQERWDIIPGAEPQADFADRIRRGFASVLKEAAGTKVVAVVHGGVIGEICSQATGSRPFAFLSVDNGSITRLAILPDGRTILRSFNDTSHLA